MVRAAVSVLLVLYILQTAAGTVLYPTIKYTGRKRVRPEDGEGEPSAKRQKRDTETEDDSTKAVDSGIQWHVNFTRFNQYFADQAIISAVAEKIDETAACVMRIVLKLSSEKLKATTPCPAIGPEIYTIQIVEAKPDTPSLTRDELEQYLKTLVDDQVRFLHRAGDSGGGSYAVNYRHDSEVLCAATIEAVVRERFGSKCLRIFRLLMLKKALEQRQVSELAMLPTREAKNLLYLLVTESYVTQLEVPRTPDYAPSRTFYLYSVNLPQVARIVMERCYKALGNLIARRLSEMKENKRLLEKFELYERQQQELGEREGEEEVEEVLTPDEREKVEKVKLNLHSFEPRGFGVSQFIQLISKLENGELQLDETMATISDYIRSLSQSLLKP